MFKRNNVDLLFIGTALFLLWKGYFTWETAGILIILFGVYNIFERGPKKGLVRK